MRIRIHIALTIGKENEREGSLAVAERKAGKYIRANRIREYRSGDLAGRALLTTLSTFWSSTNLRNLNSPIVRVLNTVLLPVIGELSPNSPRGTRSISMSAK